MASPTPKPPEERINRRPPLRGEWRDLEPLEAPVLPDLPRGIKWDAEVRVLWDAWRQDPVTQTYGPADVAYALETIRLRQAAVPTTMAEIRLRMDSLGLTPKGRRDLRLRIRETETPTTKEPERKAPAPRKRAHLSVVP